MPCALGNSHLIYSNASFFADARARRMGLPALSKSHVTRVITAGMSKAVAAYLLAVALRVLSHVICSHHLGMITAMRRTMQNWLAGWVGCLQTLRRRAACCV